MRKGNTQPLMATLFDGYRETVFYLVILVFVFIDLLQTFLMQGAVPGMTEARIAGAIVLVIFAALAAFYRFTGMLKTASVLLMAAAYAGSIYAALKQGGSPTPTLNYLPFLPIVATVLLGRKGGVVAACASVTAILFCTYAAQSGLATPSTHTAAELRLLTGSSYVLLALGVTAYAVIYETLIVKSMSAVNKAKNELEDKAADLEESKEFLSAVMEAAHDGIVAADASGKLSIFNHTAREFHGIDAQPLDSAEWPSTYNLYEADGETPMTPESVPLFRALQGERVVGSQMAIAVPGLDIRYVIANATPLYNQKKELIGAVATMRDVTTERLQEAEIRTQNREIDQFARVASLDLQAPLNRIIMTSEALANSPEVRASAKTRTDLAAVATAAKKMGALIKDVLYMSRLPIGEISLQPVAARDCIEAAIDLAGVNEADCRLDFRFTGSPEVTADPKSLTHVFKNLIENVWKHSTPGVRAHAEFTCVVEDGAAILGVKDNGPGMTREQVERVFIPLDRIRTDEDSDGSGLGLPICLKSITRMGGEFWVETEPGKGCHFRLRLPLASGQTALAS